MGGWKGGSGGSLPPFENNRDRGDLTGRVSAVGRLPKRIALAVLLVLVAIGVAGFFVLRPDRRVRVATGSISHLLCSGVFVSGVPADQVYREIFMPIPGMELVDRVVRREVDVARREVRAALLGFFESRSVYRDGLGCLVVHDPLPTNPTPSERVGALVHDAPALLPEIAGPEVVEPRDERLRAALERAFVEPREPPYRQTRAVVVVHEGRVIAERYAPGYGVDTPVPGNSDTKSVISALIGILVRERRLSVDQAAPVRAWQGAADPRRAITIDHLLRMTSGLAWREPLTGVDPANSSDRMIFLERDMAAFVERVPLETTPGITWTYNSGNTMILSRVIRDAVGGRTEDVLRFAHRELFGPLGMRRVTLEFDATGTPVGARAMLAPPRDWARFGVLYVNDGVIGGRRILPEGWVRYSASPTPVASFGYGAGFWTNLGSSAGAERRRGWGMPPDSFFASGWIGQLVVIVPSARLVVARFGASHGPRGDIDGVSRLVGEVTSALSARTSR